MTGRHSSPFIPLTVHDVDLWVDASEERLAHRPGRGQAHCPTCGESWQPRPCAGYRDAITAARVAELPRHALVTMSDMVACARVRVAARARRSPIAAHLPNAVRAVAPVHYP